MKPIWTETGRIEIGRVVGRGEQRDDCCTLERVF